VLLLTRDAPPRIGGAPSRGRPPGRRRSRGSRRGPGGPRSFGRRVHRDAPRPRGKPHPHSRRTAAPAWTGLQLRRESGSEIALGPLTSKELERLLEREREIASAVDERYARLRLAVESPTPMFEGELLLEVISVLSPDPNHSQLPFTLKKELEEIPPSEYLRAIPREPGDELERRLLDLSDHCYRLVVGSLQIWFEHEDEVFTARGQGVDAMNGLNMVNRLVVERGLLPALTPPPASDQRDSGWDRPSTTRAPACGTSAGISKSGEREYARAGAAKTAGAQCPIPVQPAYSERSCRYSRPSG
jgi:hypothetical protein